MLRILDELAGRLRADGLPGRRLARATAGVRAWAGIVARHGQLPAVKVAGKNLTRPATASGERARPVPVVRLDATLVEAASPGAEQCRVWYSRYASRTQWWYRTLTERAMSARRAA